MNVASGQLDVPWTHIHRRGQPASPGDYAGVVEEPAGRAVVGQGRELDRDRCALLRGADAAEAVEVGRGVAGAAGVDQNAGVTQFLGVLDRDGVEERLRR